MIDFFYDTVAFLVVFVASIFGVVPAIGSVFNYRFSSYREDLIAGLLVVFCSAIVAAGILLLSWSVGRVFEYAAL